MISKRIYLDYNATTPTDPRVVEAMLPYFHKKPGNASSRNHSYGWEAEEAVNQARLQIANLLQVDEKEIVFTSGATESNNLALKGVFDRYSRKGNHVITVKTEHKAVLDPCRQIEKWGGKVSYLDVDAHGRINPGELERSITDQTILVAIMWSNNETGVIQPVEDIGKICKRNEVLFFCDATQAVGKIEVNPKAKGIHLLSFSAHKMYGPKGVGALFVNRRKPRVSLSPLLDGGAHELGMRSGTLNVPGIVGFGKAAALSSEEMKEEVRRLGMLRDKLEHALVSELEEVCINGDRKYRMAHVSNLSFRHVDAEKLMTANQDIAVSSGSACTSSDPDPSHVLLAMGLREDLVHSSLRFSLGRFTTESEIEYAITSTKKAVEQLRNESPIWEMFKDGMDLENV